MYFVLQTPSLQHMAEVKIVSHLWSQPDILTQIRLSCNGIQGYQLRKSAEWKATEETVKSKVSALPIPQLCTKQLSNFIKPLGMQIIEWCEYHDGKSTCNNFQTLDNFLPDQLCWTMHGTIDHKKTAELMVKDEKVDVERRYEVACINCLEDEARELIKSIGEEKRREYMNGVMHWGEHEDLGTFFTCTVSGDTRHLNRHFKGLLSPGESISKYVFADTLDCGNRATCEYLFKKLNRRDKKRLLVEYQREELDLGEVRTCNMLYYLSLMNDEEQELVLKTNIKNVIVNLLDWPFQSLIVEVAQRWWRYMNKYNCVEVLNCITEEIRPGFQDYDYPQLFWECWRLTPPDHKQHCLNDSKVLYNLIKTSKEEFIQLVLNEALSHQLKKLVETKCEKMSRALMDESAISDAALIECKETAASNSSNDLQDEEKRLRSEYVDRLVNVVMQNRMKSREKCRCI